MSAQAILSPLDAGTPSIDLHAQIAAPSSTLSPNRSADHRMAHCCHAARFVLGARANAPFETKHLCAFPFDASFPSHRARE